MPYSCCKMATSKAFISASAALRETRSPQYHSATTSGWFGGSGSSSTRITALLGGAMAVRSDCPNVASPQWVGG
jgi:hypothetical protein